MNTEQVVELQKKLNQTQSDVDRLLGQQSEKKTRLKAIYEKYKVANLAELEKLLAEKTEEANKIIQEAEEYINQTSAKIQAINAALAE